MHYCQGTYHRDDAGIWRYAWNEPVPGARDLTVADLVPPGGPDARSAADLAPQARELVVGMLAPELDINLMLTVGQVADRAHVSKATIDSYRYRGLLPEPQVTVGRTPLWARPVVERWVARREAGIGMSSSSVRRPAKPSTSTPDRRQHARRR